MWCGFFSNVLCLDISFLLNACLLFTRSKEFYLFEGVGRDKLNRFYKLHQRSHLLNWRDFKLDIVMFLGVVLYGIKQSHIQKGSVGGRRRRMSFLFTQ